MPPLTRCCCVKLDLACLIVRKLRKGCVHSRENSSYDPYCCTLLGRLVAQGGSKRVMLKLISISLSYTVRTRVPRMILIFSEKNTFSEKNQRPLRNSSCCPLKKWMEIGGSGKNNCPWRCEGWPTDFGETRSPLLIWPYHQWLESSVKEQTCHKSIYN